MALVVVYLIINTANLSRVKLERVRRRIRDKAENLMIDFFSLFSRTEREDGERSEAVLFSRPQLTSTEKRSGRKNMAKRALLSVSQLCSLETRRGTTVYKVIIVAGLLQLNRWTKNTQFREGMLTMVLAASSHRRDYAVDCGCFRESIKRVKSGVTRWLVFDPEWIIYLKRRQRLRRTREIFWFLLFSRERASHSLSEFLH